ncbi:MAG: hypothetical protein AB7H96_21205 [Vicinamibacterales bacterium]
MRAPAALLACLALSACAAPEPTPFRPSSTTREIMNGVIDPSADALWDAVEVVATLEGTEHKQPRTDDDWKVLRGHAVTLVEASNLLLIPGRHVAQAGQKAEDPRVDLNPEEIEVLILKDAGAWATRAHRLHDAAVEALKAIDAKDVNALLNAGETLDGACESCHRNYWYRTPPPELPPAGGQP